MVSLINNNTYDITTIKMIPLPAHPQSYIVQPFIKTGTVLFDSSESETDFEFQHDPLILPHVTTSDLPSEDDSRTNTQYSTTV